MLFRNNIMVLLLGLNSFSAFAIDNNSGFDLICQIYTEAKNSSMTKEQINNYIFDNVENRVKTIDAIEAHTAVFNLEPKKRYPIFKESAEYSLKKKWDCNAVKLLMK